MKKQKIKISERLELIIKDNTQMLIHIFKVHPNNRVALTKDHVGLDEADCEAAYQYYLATGFRPYKTKQMGKRTSEQIELLRGIGISVIKADLSIAVPYGLKLNGQALETIKKLEKFGFTTIYSTEQLED